MLKKEEECYLEINFILMSLEGKNILGLEAKMVFFYGPLHKLSCTIITGTFSNSIGTYIKSNLVTTLHF